ncbi:MAG TPA: hypothetical protein VEU98_08735 [Candidatus Eremiobacteraceae bacterium]|nr:hypothetical protein [Candidatus Eremiobacteraceae bacterium]
MLDSRRSFLTSFAAVSTLALLQQQPPTPVRPRSNPMPDHPEPGQKLPSGQPGTAKVNNQAALVAHEQDLRDATDQLLIRVQEFRTQLDGTHTADVFSVGMYKQTQEIERLAKLLRSRAKP